MNLQPSYNYPSITEDYNSEQPHFGNFVMDASNTVDDNVRFSPSLTDSTNNNNSCLEYVNNTNYYRYYNNNDNCQLVQTSNGYHLGAKNLPLKQHSMFCHWSTNDSKSTKKDKERRRKVTTTINELKNRLPVRNPEEKTKWTQLQVLSHAVDYIKVLKEKRARLTYVHQKLQFIVTGNPPARDTGEWNDRVQGWFSYPAVEPCN